MVKGKAKKITSIVFILIFIMSIVCPVYADKKLVVDQAGVFTATEEADLEKDAKALGSKFIIDIVIVTTSDADGKSSRKYADDYFDDNGYGVGEDKDGILFLLDFDNREAYISTSGNGIRYLTDKKIDSILDDVFNSGITEGDNYSAAKAFLESTGGFLASIEVSSYTGKELLVDQAELFTKEEKADLRYRVKTLSDKYSLDIVIVTTADTEGKSLKEYANNYFDSNRYGVGQYREGILFLLDFGNREAFIFTNGQEVKVLTNTGIQMIMDMVYYKGLSVGDPLGAVNAFMEYTKEIFTEGAPKKLVADQADVFKAEEAAKLWQDARALSKKYKMDIVIVTTSDTLGKKTRDYADDYFYNNGYGTGDDRDGVLFLLDYENEMMCISTSGSGTKYLNDERFERIFNNVKNSRLAEGDNFAEASAFLESIGGILAEGVPDDQYNVPEPVSNTLSTAEVVVGAVIAGIFGLCFYLSTKGEYQGYPEPIEFEYKKNSVVNLGISDDSLVNTYVTTRIIPKPDPPSSSSSKRSTTHTSGSGRSHGGGGRSFTGGSTSGKSTTHTSGSGRSHGGGGRSF